MIPFLAYLASPRRLVNDLTHATGNGWRIATAQHHAILRYSEMKHPFLFTGQLGGWLCATPAQPAHAIRIKLVPCYACGNRGDTEMSVRLPAR